MNSIQMRTIMDIMKVSPGVLRFILNTYPPYLFTGIHVDAIGHDWKRVDVRMKLRWYNRNAVGTHFGGSLYSMVDPHLMLMLMRLLGEDYIVWDKSAGIEFVRPGKTTVYAGLRITDADLEQIRGRLRTEKRVLPDFEVRIVDTAGEVVAKVFKKLYIRRKRR